MMTNEQLESSIESLARIIRDMEARNRDRSERIALLERRVTELEQPQRDDVPPFVGTTH